MQDGLILFVKKHALKRVRLKSNPLLLNFTFILHFLTSSIDPLPSLSYLSWIILRVNHYGCKKTGKFDV